MDPRQTNNGRLQLAAAFAVKLLLGSLYGYIYLQYYGGDDTWKHLQASLKETNLLLQDPRFFFLNEFTPQHALQEGKNWWQVLQLYVNDLQYALLVKTMSFVNLLTGGNYYLNLVPFNALVFAGHYLLFKRLSLLYPLKKKLLLAAIFFFLPALFWLSGYRIDGLLFFFFSWYVYQLLSPQNRRVAGIAGMAVAFAGVIICRAEVAVLLIPATVVYLLAKTSGKGPRSLVLVYAAAIVLFFASDWLLPGQGAASRFAETQKKFMALEGTRYPLNSLHAHWTSYIKVLPQAIMHTFFRPFIWEARGPLQWMAAIEVLIFWMVVIYLLAGAGPGRRQNWNDPTIIFFLSLAISLYLAIGFIVPFPGAIVRYKAIPELLLVICAVLAGRNKVSSNYIKF